MKTRLKIDDEIKFSSCKTSMILNDKKNSIACQIEEAVRNYLYLGHIIDVSGNK